MKKKKNKKKKSKKTKTKKNKHRKIRKIKYAKNIISTPKKSESLILKTIRIQELLTKQLLNFFKKLIKK